MNEIQVGLIFLGICLLLTLILVVWAAMVCGLPCTFVGGTG